MVQIVRPSKEVFVINKAFQSLSFRKSYSMPISNPNRPTRGLKTRQQEDNLKAATANENLKTNQPQDNLKPNQSQQANQQQNENLKPRRIGPETLGKGRTYGAILIVRRNNEEPAQYALVQGRYTGKWSFPKGHPNKGEEAMNCTMREVAEETGIENLPEPTEYVRIGYGNYYVFSLKDTIPLIPRDTNEIMNTKWATLDEMETLSLNADANMYRKSIQVSDSTNQTTQN